MKRNDQIYISIIIGIFIGFIGFLIIRCHQDNDSKEIICNNKFLGSVKSKISQREYVICDSNEKPFIEEIK